MLQTKNYEPRVRYFGTIRQFTAPDISGMVTLSGQANQRGAALPSYRIVTARFEGHNVNITYAQTSIHDSNQIIHYTRSH